MRPPILLQRIIDAIDFYVDRDPDFVVNGLRRGLRVGTSVSTRPEMGSRAMNRQRRDATASQAVGHQIAHRGPADLDAVAAQAGELPR